MEKTDVCVVTRSLELTTRLVDSLAEFVPAERVGTLAISWNGGDQADEYTLMNYARGRGFDVKMAEMPYNFAKNNNRLVKDFCRSDAVLFMNDDAYFQSDAVTPMLEALGDERVGTVGIRLNFPDGSVQHAGIFAAWTGDGSFRGVGHIGYKSRAEFPDLWTFGSTGACMMTRRKDFLAVGGFDEGYECCYEDAQYNFEMSAKLGLRNVTLNSVSAVHAESSTRKQSFGAGDGAKLAKYCAQNATAIWKALAKKPAVNSKYEGRNA